MAVAAAVKSGSCDCGLGVYSAASALGLDFTPVGVYFSIIEVIQSGTTLFFLVHQLSPNALSNHVLCFLQLVFVRVLFLILQNLHLIPIDSFR